MIIYLATTISFDCLSRMIMKSMMLITRHFSTILPKPRSQKFHTNAFTINNNAIKELHGHLIRTEKHTDPHIISHVLRSYSLSPSTLSKAQLVFNEIDQPTFLLWYFMMRAWSKSDDPAKTIRLYHDMRVYGMNVNDLTAIFVLKACGKVADVFEGRKVHVNVIKLGYGSYVYVSNSLIYMYGFCGEMGSAHKVFDEMNDRDLVSWNSLVCGYSRGNKYKEVLGLFERMRARDVRADAVTMVKVLIACNVLNEWSVADSMVDHISRNRVEIDVYLGNTMIDMYGKRGLVELAQRVFDHMNEKNMVSWNSLMMVYVKVRDLVSARRLFDEMPLMDVISWTSMITGYCQAGQYADAVELFRDMMVNRVKPDEVTVASVLSACAHLGKLDLGREIHQFIAEYQIRVDIYVGNALIDMYCKCGDVQKALQVFVDMKERDSVSWTAVISGLAVNGFADSAIQVFEEMLTQNFRPSNGAFVGLLLACAHAGLLDKGLHYFESMQNVYGITPQMKHYGCMVDLLSRSGKLERAYDFILKMPIQPDVVLWRILLSACKLHGNVDLAATVSAKLLESDAGNSGNYVLISDTYAGAEKWDAATKFRDLMEDNYVHKPSAWSSVEVPRRISSS